jgi:hypothetical protein
MVVQTSRGTPAHQGLYTLFILIIAVIISFVLSQYILKLEILLSLLLSIVFFFSLLKMLLYPENYQKILRWLLPAMVILPATLWPAANEMELANRVMMMAIGGMLGIFSSLIIFPLRPYWEFRIALTPMMDALIKYSSELEKYIQNNQGAVRILEKRLLKIENILRSRRNQYPEWVFEPGFNRNLRSSFRYILVQMERVTDAFFSLDYHARQPVDTELLADIAPQIIVVLSKNVELLKIIRAFFANESVDQSLENFTSDITNVHQAMQNLMPGSIELLDVTPDYVNLASLARDVIDIRELLLQIITGLPIDDLAVSD